MAGFEILEQRASSCINADGQQAHEEDMDGYRRNSKVNIGQDEWLCQRVDKTGRMFICHDGSRHFRITRVRGEEDRRHATLSSAIAHVSGHWRGVCRQSFCIGGVPDLHGWTCTWCTPKIPIFA